MAAGKTITVVVIDDNRILREALAAMLDALADIHAVASADALIRNGARSSDGFSSTARALV